jgi:hypothetical protein
LQRIRLNLNAAITKSPGSGNGNFGFSEGVARLDRIQIILPTDRAVYDPLPIALSEDALAVLLSMFRSWFGSVEEDLNAYKELLTGTLPPEALPRTTA